MNGVYRCVFQLGVVLCGQQRLVIPWAVVQSFLCTTGCHPNPGPLLMGHTFTHIPFSRSKQISSWRTWQITRGAPKQNRAKFVSCTCQALLHVWFLLQELGPSHGPSVKHSDILLHHILIWFKVVRSFKAIRVNPDPRRPGPCTNEWQLGPFSPHPSFFLLVPDDCCYNSLHRVRFLQGPNASPE